LSTDAGRHRVTLVSFEPHPRRNVRIAANAYRATLKIDRQPE
jgi:hypothetical protein